MEVLLVEDRESDILLTREALKNVDLIEALTVARSASEAWGYLSEGVEGQRGFRPDLILLDLNLPGMSGKEFLVKLKNDPRFRRIPVLVLTTSKLESDVVDAYDLGASCYITKPVDFFHFQDVVEAIKAFWFSVVRLPLNP